MIKKYGFLFITFMLSFILFLGSNETRIKRASFLSKTIFFPYSVSVKSISAHFNLKEKNYELSKEIARLTLQNNTLENTLIQIQNSKLPLNIDKKFVVAEVIGISGNFNDKNYIIDKGFIDSLDVDLPVITSHGVVGKIITVFRNKSIFLPISHRDFKLGVLDSETRVQGILETDNFGITYMNMIPLDSEINVGDTILTSNISEIFPKSLPVGKVKSLKIATNGLYNQAEVDLFCDLNKLEQVIILFDKKGENNEE